MPDAPDWYTYRLQSPRHVVGDVGELAARLGSPDVFDRQGDVIFYDRFQHGLSAWRTTVAGAGAALKASVDNAQWPGLCVQGETPSDGGLFLFMTRNFACLDTERVGLEVAINPEDLNDYFLFDIAYDNTEIKYTGRLKVDQSNTRLQVQDETGGYQTFDAAAGPFYGTGYYANYKLVIDLSTGLYARVLWNQTIYDVSEYQLYPGTPGSTPYLAVNLWMFGNNGENDTVRLGHVIVTAAEP